MVTKPTVGADSDTWGATLNAALDELSAGVTGAVTKSTLTTKGDLLAASDVSTPVRVPVGADGAVLTASAAATPGVAWVPDSGWQYPAALLNGWVNNDAAGTGTGTVRYRKFPSGLVILQGLIRAGAASTGTDMFVLPAGYRPAEQEIFLVFCNNASPNFQVRVDVLANGTVDHVGPPITNTTGNISLSGIVFYADA